MWVPGAPQPRDAEVGELQSRPGVQPRADQDVARLDVAVDDSASVGVGQGIQQCQQHRADPRPTEQSAMRRECASAAQFHYEVGSSFPQLTFAEAIEKYCTEEVDVEARLQVALKEFDGSVYLEGMQQNFERLDEQYDVVRRVAKKCRLRIEKAASLEPEAVNKLHSAQRGLFRVIKPVYDALMSAASGSFKHAIELQGQAQVLEEQLVASERLVEGILTAIDELHPSVKLAIENLKAETERVEAEGVAADG